MKDSLEMAPNNNRKQGPLYQERLYELLRLVCLQVEQGNECGASVSGYNDWVVGDTIQAFNVIKKQRTLESASAVATKAMALPPLVSASAPSS